MSNNSVEHISNKKIDIMSMLPEYLAQGIQVRQSITNPIPPESVEVGINAFVQELEDYLNGMYTGTIANEITVTKTDLSDIFGEGFTVIQNDDDPLISNWLNSDSLVDPQIQNVSLNTPIEEEESTIPVTSQAYIIDSKSVEQTGISILEKVYRLLNLKDPWTMDFNDIHKYAGDIGYDINVNLFNLGLSETDDTVTEEIESQTRFLVDNLVHWYKIKGTADSYRIMLFSFGMIGGISTLYTRNYSTELLDWRHDYLYYDSAAVVNMYNLDNVPDEFYPTPHFSIWYDVNATSVGTLLTPERLEAVKKAVLAIRPAHTVFDGLEAQFVAQAADTVVYVAEQKIKILGSTGQISEEIIMTPAKGKPTPMSSPATLLTNLADSVGNLGIEEGDILTFSYLANNLTIPDVDVSETFEVLVNSTIEDLMRAMEDSFQLNVEDMSGIITMEIANGVNPDLYGKMYFDFSNVSHTGTSIDNFNLTSDRSSTSLRLINMLQYPTTVTPDGEPIDYYSERKFYDFSTAVVGNVDWDVVWI